MKDSPGEGRICSSRRQLRLEEASNRRFVVIPLSIELRGGAETQQHQSHHDAHWRPRTGSVISYSREIK